MDFSSDPREADFRRQVREFIAANLTPEIIEECYRTGTLHNSDFHRALAERGWIGLPWPQEFGGLGRGSVEAVVLAEELNAAHAPVYGLNPTNFISEIVAMCAASDLREKVLANVKSGDWVLCLGYSEPESGSDVAAARTRAIRDGNSWVINGQKVFTSNAEAADFVLLLTRTDPELPKHAGLTLFLVPLNTQGIEIQPIRTLGERTNMTFYRDVAVEDSWRVGEVNGGWDVMKRALTIERGGNGGYGHLRRLLGHVMEVVQSGGQNIAEGFRTDALCGRLATELEVGRLLDLHASWLANSGRESTVSSSMAKLFISEAFTRAASDSLDVLGPIGLWSHGNDRAEANGWVEYDHRFAVPMTVYGGSSEVQRSIIAEMGLGLPRSR